MQVLEALGEMLTTGLLIMGFGVSLILIIGLILDTIEGSKNRKKKVHIVKGNGWIRYYTNEGWSKE